MIDTLLDRALAACGGNQAEVARRIGSVRDVVWAWCDGRRVPSLPSLLKLAEITGDDPLGIVQEHMARKRAERGAA